MDFQHNFFSLQYGEDYIWTKSKRLTYLLCLHQAETKVIRSIPTWDVPSVLFKHCRSLHHLIPTRATQNLLTNYHNILQLLLGRISLDLETFFCCYGYN